MSLSRWFDFIQNQKEVRASSVFPLVAFNQDSPFVPKTLKKPEPKDKKPTPAASSEAASGSQEASKKIGKADTKAADKKRDEAKEGGDKKKEEGKKAKEQKPAVAAAAAAAPSRIGLSETQANEPSFFFKVLEYSLSYFFCFIRSGHFYC